MDTWTKYMPGSTEVPSFWGFVGKRLGRAKFYIQYRNGSSGSWINYTDASGNKIYYNTNSNHISSTVSASEAYDPVARGTGDDYTITIPSDLTWNGTEPWYSREFRIVQVIYETNASGTQVTAGGGECELVMSGCVRIKSTRQSVQTPTSCGTANTGGNKYDSRVQTENC
jgi:hypothetical protein